MSLPNNVFSLHIKRTLLSWVSFLRNWIYFFSCLLALDFNPLFFLFRRGWTWSVFRLWTSLFASRVEDNTTFKRYNSSFSLFARALDLFNFCHCLSVWLFDQTSMFRSFSSQNILGLNTSSFIVEFFLRPRWFSLHIPILLILMLCSGICFRAVATSYVW